MVKKNSTFEISQHKQTLSHLRGDLSLSPLFPLSVTHTRTEARFSPGPVNKLYVGSKGMIHIIRAGWRLV